VVVDGGRDGPVWTPPRATVEAAASTRFARAHGLAATPSCWNDRWPTRRGSGTPSSTTSASSSTIRTTSSSTSPTGPQWARWFGGGRLNVTRTCLDRHADGPHAGRVAVTAEAEDGTVRRLTYAGSGPRCRASPTACTGSAWPRETGWPSSCRSVSRPVVGFYAFAHLGAVVVPIFSGFSAARRSPAAA
jgi:acetyl-CoA synthetase